ncbi:hypothetical protein NIES22_04460 [Calothrix brevissima NIES-22]|nr:hypothetical protein NIES22_04460 [Calothrix brevissima NIES-22]
MVRNSQAIGIKVQPLLLTMSYVGLLSDFLNTCSPPGFWWALVLTVLSFNALSNLLYELQ